MKVIYGKGYLNNGTQAWLAVVPDDATSCTDPRRTQVLAPAFHNRAGQGAWLDGYAERVLDEWAIREGKAYEGRAYGRDKKGGAE